MLTVGYTIIKIVNSFIHIISYLYLYSFLCTASIAAAAANPNKTEDPKDLSTEEMRRLIERNEVVGGGSHLQPFDPSNIQI